MQINIGRKDLSMDQVPRKLTELENVSVVRQQTSMGTLISWNISKAIEVNPGINLKSAIRATQQKLEDDGRDASALSQSPGEQYLVCALLAWQQMGHNGADSLHRFVEMKQKQLREQDKTMSTEKIIPSRPMLSPGSFISYEESSFSKGVGSSNYESYSLVGPVVKLPVDTKIVMRLDNAPTQRPPRRNTPEKDLMHKIDAACCMDSACMEKLSQLDKSTKELRTRAERLARREAERVELLERAEAAWKDLELGYQRRLAMAEEKEEDMAKHIKKIIEERNGYKNACSNLAQQLRERGEVAEKERAKLIEAEKEVCDSACMRLHISEEAARLDAALADQQCNAAQLDRDLQFKEEQIRRKIQTLESELESARCLTHEAERAMHSELAALRQQVAQVSNQLLEEDAENGLIKEELESLRQQKMEMVEDLDGCKLVCDGRIQGKMDLLKSKREQLKELQEKVMECQCKMPVDASVEAKRTPSLAALCQCSPEDKYLDSCSCTSLRSSLLSNLLADLFGGLQSELGGCGSQMPCQLLKCLEDRHNWDKPSVVKSNLKSYFSQLLIGELDIAIATSIEKYHAKWVGASCADAARMIPDRGPDAEGWQERALERRAQKLAAKLAEQLFHDRQEQLTAKAKEIVRNGPPPCECRPQPAAVYPVLVKQPVISGMAAKTSETTRTYWRRTHNDVTQLKVQLEDLKKESIKKEDLKLMEENIVKLVQRATVTDEINTESVIENVEKNVSKKDNGIHRSSNTERDFKHVASTKLSSIKKKQPDLNPKKGSKNFIFGLNTDKPVRSFKKVGRSYAVNLCLCGSQKDTKKLFQVAKQDLNSLHDSEIKKNPKGVANIIPQIYNAKESKPLTFRKQSHNINNEKRGKISRHPLCRSNVMCFHKQPSNTSIDKLFKTLAKWQSDLTKLDINKNMEIVPDTDKKPKSNQNASINVSKNAFPHRSNVIVANVSKSIEAPSAIPVATESEYMGAINFESIGSDNRESINVRKSTIFNSAQTSFEKHGKILKNSPIVHQCLNNELSAENKQSEERSFVQDEIQNKNEIETNEQKSSIFPSECQYYIKFLGVTLTDANQHKNTPEKNEKAALELPKSINKKNRRGINHPEVWYNNINCFGSKQPYTQGPSCDCSVKYDEVQTVLDGVVVNKHGDFKMNEDKSMDTPSFQNTREQMRCVCCDLKLDESKDLEVNAFQLLEEHLREKLEEFKTVNCKSSCIKPDQEERLFSTILQRIKQIITDNTNGISCKCDPDMMAQGSWHRAYMLLEEYLKIKIKRVQCSCNPTESTNVTVLPTVLEKVCTLIDNDFKRLKEVCNCNKVLINTCVYENDTPEKDINSFESYEQANKRDTSIETQRADKINKEISNNSLLVTQNTSSQMSPNLDTSTKSCDAMQVHSQNDQTSKLICNKCCKVTEVNYDSGLCSHSTKITKSYVELFGSNEMIVNQCINLHDKERIHATDLMPDKSLIVSDEQTFVRKIPKQTLSETRNIDNTGIRNKTPYIGITVDCSCNSMLGRCTCTKSLISEKNDNINSIWNTLTSNKLRRNNISYIMNGVTSKDVEETEKKNAEEYAITKTIPSMRKDTCDSKTGPLYFEEIVLKDSNEKLNKSFMSTTTSGDDICFGHDFNSEPLEWHQCSSNTKQKKVKVSDCIDGTCESSLHYPLRKLVSRGRSSGLLKSDPINLPKSLSSDCDCNMVPMCHVKMLVENIESKLIHSKCTCDSLCSKICPVHSQKA